MLDHALLCFIMRYHVLLCFILLPTSRAASFGIPTSPQLVVCVRAQRLFKLGQTRLSLAYLAATYNSLGEGTLSVRLEASLFPI